MGAANDRPNLYELFHRFYQLGLPSVLGSDGASLYWALVQKSNELRDPSTFTFSNTEAKERSGISHDQTFQRARQKLINAGMVQYSPGSINTVGIYAGLDLDLDPDDVARRMKLHSQTTHNPLTSGSQTTHTPITSDSQPAHDPTHEQADFVSITREGKSNGEKSRDSSTMNQEDTPAGEAATVWVDVIAYVEPTFGEHMADTLRRCQPVHLSDGRLLVIRPDDGRVAQRLERVSTVITQRLRQTLGPGYQVEFCAAGDIQARAGP